MNPRAYVEGIIENWAPSFKVSIQPEVAIPAADGSYHFTTVWSKPTQEQPVPKAVARVEMRVWLDAGRLTHEYRLESHQLVRGASTAFREAWLNEILRNKQAIQRRLRYESDDAAKLSDDEDEDEADAIPIPSRQSRSGGNGQLAPNQVAMNRRSPGPSPRMGAGAAGHVPDMSASSTGQGAIHMEQSKDKEFVTRVRRSDTMARGVGSKDSPKNLLRGKRGR